MKEMDGVGWRGSSENVRKLSTSNESSGAGSWRSSQDSSTYNKDLCTRPPIYNPEDYATSLKKWINKSFRKNMDQPDVPVVPPVLRDNEMSLRQFLSVTDLLNKLKTDLRLAYASFVQEFISDPIDGVNLLLDLLKTIQQKDPQNKVKVTPTIHRRTLLEENSCLQCLQYCLRTEETIRRLAVSSVGLFTVALCIMSSVSKSRIISLELLSKVCGYSSSSGHNAVSEAMSTMRLRFGEPVRFRFLVSMLNGATSDLLLAGLRFLNSFLEMSPTKQTQLYIQAELEEAGFNSDTFKKVLTSRDRPDASVLDEYNRWSKLYIDVEVLNNNYRNKCKEVASLKEKISQLEAQILKTEKDTLSTQETACKDHYPNLDHRIPLSSKNIIEKRYNSQDGSIKVKCENGGNSTPAEDEGISSSDQDDSEEEIVANTTRDYSSFYNSKEMNRLSSYAYQEKHDVEPTIDEVMEDFQNIINDVQNQNYRNEQKLKDKTEVSNRRAPLFQNSDDELLVLEKENDIVPSLILPEPPKKSRSLHYLNKNIETNPFFEDESLDNSNFSCVSRYNNFHEFSEKFTSVDQCYEKSHDFGFSGVVGHVPRPTLRRIETFHHLQSNDKLINSSPPAMALTNPNSAKPRKCQNEKIKIMNANNKTNYIMQNKSNYHKEIINRNKEEMKLCRSVSMKPINGLTKSKGLPFTKLNPVSYFSKSNLYPKLTTTNDQVSFTLRRQNAGLYSERSQCIASSPNHYPMHQVMNITSEYPKRSLNGLKQINLNIRDGKIMDLPSGLY